MREQGTLRNVKNERLCERLFSLSGLAPRDPTLASISMLLSMRVAGVSRINLEGTTNLHLD